ncbi:MAG: hypothetical protein ABMA02_08700 [Saprospiraceae bacterium]
MYDLIVGGAALCSLGFSALGRRPHYWTFSERDLPGLPNLEGLDARKTEMSSSVVGNLEAEFFHTAPARLSVEEKEILLADVKSANFHWQNGELEKAESRLKFLLNDYAHLRLISPDLLLDWAQLALLHHYDKNTGATYHAAEQATQLPPQTEHDRHFRGLAHFLKNNQAQAGADFEASKSLGNGWYGRHIFLE